MKSKNHNIPLPALLSALGVTKQELSSNIRTQRLSDARAMVAYILGKHSHMTQQDIANLFETSQAGVCKMQMRHQSLLDSNREYRSKWEILAKYLSEHLNINIKDYEKK